MGSDTDPTDQWTSIVCQEWVTTYGGSEAVAAELADLVDADRVLTFARRQTLAKELFGDRAVVPTRLGERRFAQDHWQWMLPLMPSAWRRHDVEDADLVVTSSHACSNAVPADDRTVRVSYCHTPMRYAWYWRDEIDRFPKLARPAWPIAARWLRSKDKSWSTRVHRYVANSASTAARIRDAYGVASDVVHPPVDTEFWTPDPSVEREDFFLVAGRLVAYKRPQAAIEAAGASGARLVVAGSGPLLESLREMAGPTVEFVVQPSREELRDLYRRTTALIYPQVEEFGISLVEAASCGAPALARGAGGALETVVDERTGVHVADDQELAEAIKTFQGQRYDSVLISQNASRFGVARFRREMADVIAKTVARHSPRADADDWANSLIQRG